MAAAGKPKTGFYVAIFLVISALGGYAVRTDADGRTSVADVLACGDVCGYVGPEAAAAAGARTGAAAAKGAL